MSYSSVPQVQSYVPLIPITDSGKPSTTDVLTFLEDRANAIDSALASRGYVVPVTEPTWLLADLARLNAMGAAGDVWLAAFVMAPGVNATANGQALTKAFNDRITELQAGVGVPVMTAYQEVDQAVRSNATGPTSCPGRPLFRRREVWE